jgi:hypothetical protein
MNGVQMHLILCAGVVQILGHSSSVCQQLLLLGEREAERLLDSQESAFRHADKCINTLAGNPELLSSQVVGEWSDLSYEPGRGCKAHRTKTSSWPDAKEGSFKC